MSAMQLVSGSVRIARSSFRQCLGSESCHQKKSAPNDHFTVSPYRRGVRPANGRIDGACSHPAIDVGIISSAGVVIKRRGLTSSTPDDHFAASPYCSV